MLSVYSTYVDSLNPLFRYKADHWILGMPIMHLNAFISNRTSKNPDINRKSPKFQEKSQDMYKSHRLL